MSEDQLTALLARLKEDAVLRDKLQAAGGLDAFVALAEEAGFEVSEPDWRQLQTYQYAELSDEEMEEVAGGNYTTSRYPTPCNRNEGFNC